MLNDQAAGLAAEVVSGTPRDSLHMVDVWQSQRGGRVPDSIITDTGSYSDIVFGLLHPAGYRYRPQLANLPDQRLWRFDIRADYGPLDQAARGRIDIDEITTHWEDVCQVVVSIHFGEVSGQRSDTGAAGHDAPGLGRSTRCFRAVSTGTPLPVRIPNSVGVMAADRCRCGRCRDSRSPRTGRFRTAR